MMTPMFRQTSDPEPRPMTGRARRGLRRVATRLPWLWRPLYLARHHREVYDRLVGDPGYHPDELQRDEVLARKDFIRRAFTYLAFNGIPGDYAEFGCNGAMTFRMAYHAARLVGRPTRLWGFDSFAGLPQGNDRRDRHPQWNQGTMATSLADFHALCATAGMQPDDYTVVAGYYAKTLGQDQESAAARPEVVALAYIDCDLYSSARDVLGFLLPRLGPGSVIALDDYFCASATLPSGERLAVEEAFADHPRWRLLPYQQYGWHGMSFIVEDRAAR
jgi:hypothetical protein